LYDIRTPPPPFSSYLIAFTIIETPVVLSSSQISLSPLRTSSIKLTVNPVNMAEENSSVHSNTSSAYQNDEFEAPPSKSASPSPIKPSTSPSFDQDDEIIRAYREERDRFRLPPQSVVAPDFAAPDQRPAAPTIPPSKNKPTSTFTPAAVTNIRQAQASEQQFKRRFNALKKIYESRIEHLTNSIQRTFNSVNSDDVLLAMR
jgi:hypothetical protein